MGATFSIRKEINQVAIPSATGTVIVGPVDVSNYDKFSVMYENLNTAITFLGMTVQASFDGSSWANLSTATLEVPSTLSATSIALSSRVDNSWKWLRVVGHTCQTAAVGTLELTFGGFRKP